MSRAFAAQGACYVVAEGGLIQPEDVPEQFRHLAYTGTGGSLIVDPLGEVVARAPLGKEMILTFEADASVIRSAKAAMDVAGHYSRPDVFDLRVNGVPTGHLSPAPPVGYSGGAVRLFPKPDQLTRSR